MAIVLLLILAIALAVVFRSSTRDYRCWDVIKDRWLRAGIDNSLLFNISRDYPQKDEELAELYGEYSGCAIRLGTIKSSKPRSIITVDYPEALTKKLTNYPITLLVTIERLLCGQLKIENNEPVIVDLGTGKMSGRKIHPQIAEQLLLLHTQYLRRGSVFKFNAESLSYEQPIMLPDPLSLFPILAEMVLTVNLIRENIDYLLVN